MPRAVRSRPGLAVVVLMIAALAVSVGSLRLQRGVGINGPRSFDGLVIADETVRITGQHRIRVATPAVMRQNAQTDGEGLTFD